MPPPPHTSVTPFVDVILTFHWKGPLYLGALQEDTCGQWTYELSFVDPDTGPFSPDMVGLKAEDEVDCSTSRSLEQSHGVSG